METGEPLGAQRLASTLYIAVNNKRPDSNKVKDEDKHPRLSSNHHMHTINMCMNTEKEKGKVCTPTSQVSNSLYESGFLFSEEKYLAETI